ncbi:MAG: hypothetical protein V4665_00220 [Patescibacteria group bacterium]
MNKDEIIEKEKNIIIARLKATSSELYFIDGDDSKSYSKEEIISLIEQGSSAGLEFVKTEFEFLKAFKDGRLSALLAA